MGALHLILGVGGVIAAAVALDTLVAWGIRTWRARVLEWRQ